ncbi:hypothetical protein GCM10007368_27760 [Isoptericola cucumis]|uniref:Uncharacterized protein n=1 Tax=Isoptericola cucumis TaxID=1776856 RepID=A0ABQ2B9D0_9MICO|nr:hypothetical protein GCM10007368_27760 [Isoptericola cucumis]
MSATITGDSADRSAAVPDHASEPPDPSAGGPVVLSESAPIAGPIVQDEPAAEGAPWDHEHCCSRARGRAD